MKIEKLYISNFKAIEQITFDNLSNVVIVTGSNGVGKSCVLHALRLLKSSYGGYINNEWLSWQSEFGINPKNRNDYTNIIRDKAHPIIIEASFELNTQEREYLSIHAEKLIESAIWRVKTGNFSLPPINPYDSIATEHRRHKENVTKETKEFMEVLTKELDKKSIIGRIELKNDSEPILKDNTLLELIFGTYLPEHIGVIDYHGPDRHYEKGNQNNSISINFNENVKDTYKNHSLYNYTNKYNNVKNEMMTSYIKALISKESGVESASLKVKALNDSFKELFTTFFENKNFLGVVPTEEGKLNFPVETKSGSQHDINDLSSGEKELLFGYLRLINTSPKNSIILIDEPELHLNPKMAKKLPDFYRKNIGISNNNQIWLITHSDAIIREVIGQKDFSIYHITDANVNRKDKEQANRVEIKSDVNSLIIDLVGSVSDFHLGGIVIVLEGDNSEFDRYMISFLFPEIVSNINLISAGNKSRVKGVYDILNKAATQKIINNKFYAITDKDSDNTIENQNNLTEYSWDVYHIENYLLNEKYIAKAESILKVSGSQLSSEKEIESKLKELAENDIKFHTRHRLHNYISKHLNDCIKIKADDKVLYSSFHNSIENIVNSINLKSSNELGLNAIQLKEDEITRELSDSLKTNKWKSVFRGRAILSQYVKNYCKGIDYINFRNIVINEMKRDNFQPEGMKEILNKIQLHSSD